MGEKPRLEEYSRILEGKKPHLQKNSRIFRGKKPRHGKKFVGPPISKNPTSLPVSLSIMFVQIVHILNEIRLELENFYSYHK